MKHVKLFERFVNEGFTFNGEDINTSSEKKVVKEFSWLPPNFPITVKSVDLDLRDEYNGSADIVMSNGDSINYEMYETRTPVAGQTPPYYKFSLSVNGKELTTDIDDVLQGNSYAGDILNYYVQHYLTKHWRQQR